MAWLKRRIVAWLLPEIQAQQASEYEARIHIAMREYDGSLPARIWGAVRRYG